MTSARGLWQVRVVWQGGELASGKMMANDKVEA